MKELMELTSLQKASAGGEDAWGQPGRQRHLCTHRFKPG